MLLQQSVGCVIMTVFITSHYDNIVEATPDTGVNINDYCKTIQFKDCHNAEVREKCPNRCAIVVALFKESKDRGYTAAAPRQLERAENKVLLKGGLPSPDPKLKTGTLAELQGSNLTNQEWCKHVDVQDCLKLEVKKACPKICNKNKDGPVDAYWCVHAVDANDCNHPEVKKACPIKCKSDTRIDKEWCQWVVDELDDCEDPDILKDCPAQCKSLDLSSPTAQDENWCAWAVQLHECMNERIFKSCPVFCKNFSQISPGAECGVIKPTQRVIGGHNAALHEYPWIVGIFNKFVFHCAGTLLNKDWVMTASHCFRRGSIEDFFITVGDHDLRTDDESKSVLRNLSVIVTHQGFDDPVPYANDIALVKMEKPVTLDDKIAPVCLPSPTDYENEKATIIGWGQTKAASGASILQETTVTTMTTAQCRKSQTRNWLYRIIRDDWICAHRNEGEQAADACKGDSGGPMMVVENDHWVQIGIISWGNGCALKDNPGVYTRVSSYLDWIKTNTNEGSRCSSGSNAVCHEMS